MIDMMLMLYVIYGIIGEVILVFLLYWLLPIERRARFFSMVTKRSYGVIEVVGKGRKITKHIVNLFQDFAVVRGGVFVLDPDYVYVKDGSPVIHYDEKDAFEPVEIGAGGQTKDILDKGMIKNLPEGVQMALEYAGIDKLKRVLETGLQIDKIYIKPTKMKKDKPEEKVRDPRMINAIFMKQKALAEAEGLIKLVRTLKILLYIAVAASVVAAAFGFMTYDVVSGGGIMKSFG